MTPSLVRDLMSREVKTLERNDSLSIADRVMQLERIRHMPVLDEDGLVVGVVSQRDLFRGALANALGYGKHAQEKILDTLLVKDVISSDLVTTRPDAPLAEAARVMVERKVGCLPVLDGDKLVGILTEGDFVALAAKG
ncbi:MAG: CBS domain-containing protein [Polyangiaceae bacterium]|nr:CBS domain-containing protein [Polyangiaceae bacterium]